MPITDWLHYADHDLDPICRSSSGSYGPVTDKPANLEKLRWIFTAPEKFRPGRTVQDVTAEAAGRFAQIAQALTGRGHEPQKVAHYLIQCLFAMFAEDAELLPDKLFERILAKSANAPEKVSARLGELFKSMQCPR